MELKIVFIIIVVSVSNVLATPTYSQVAKVSLDMENKSLEQVMDEIEKQSEFYFIFNQKQVDVNKTVDIRVENKLITDILPELFNGTNVQYAVFDRKILLTTDPIESNLIAVASSIGIQQKQITGIVTDKDGNPLPGVYVVVTGTTTGTITDISGRYSIGIPQGANSLTFSFIGMESQEISIGTLTQIDVTMVESAIGLEEVVVVGYGTQKKINLTGSVSAIGAAEISKRPNPSVGILIQGRVPGLQIIQQSGEPGVEKLKVAIRGMGTFSSAGSTPLVVIDGVAHPSWEALNYLDPENVETINILKDAASSSIYGARAANGVILVTTKKGAAGKTKISYHGRTGFESATFIPDFVTNSAEYMEMWNYVAERQGLPNKFPESLIEAYRNAAPGDPQYPNFDWRDAIFNPGWGQKQNLSISGGDNRTHYFAGIGYSDQDAIMRGQSYTRYTAQFNLDTKISEWMTFGTNISFLYGKKLAPAMDTRSLMMFSYDMNPTTSIHLPDGRWSVGAAIPPFYQTNNVWRLTDTSGEGGTRLNEDHEITASGYLDINITPDLLWHTTGSYNFDNRFLTIHRPTPLDPREYYFNGTYGRDFSNYKPGVENSWSRSVMPSFYSTLNYTKTFSEFHNLMVLAGYSQEYYKVRSLSAYRRDYNFENLTELDAGAVSVQTLGGNSSEWALQSFFIRINYNYNQKYLFEANARYDGSSRLYKDNRWGLFPSFSAGWRMSEENFLQDAAWLDNLKVRVSWGQLGNQNIGNYPYQSLLTSTGYVQDEVLEQAVVLNSLADQDIKWEVTSISNVGIDLDVEQGLFSLVLDVYNKNTEGILNRATIPASVGLSAPTINYGAMNNKGIEIVLGHRNRINKFLYSVDFNLSHNRNKITKLVTPSYGLQSDQVGHEFGAHYMLEWIGIFQNEGEIDAAPAHPNNPLPGDLRFKDQNDDKVIDSKDRVILAGRYPKFIYGGNINLGWKNWDLSIFVQGVQGVRHYITRRGEWPFLRMAPPTKEWRNAWTPENPTNDMPALWGYYYGPMVGNNSSYFLKNTSYMRLKNIQIGYTLPSIIGVHDLRIYVSADNWFTYAPWTTSDPERDEDIHYSYQTEAASYPNVKTLTFGLKFSIN